MDVTPVEIKRIDGAGIVVKWSDGSRHEISNGKLRAACPCATCREAQGDTSHARPLTAGAPPTAKKSMLKVIEHTLAEELNLKQIWGIGNYAIGATWGDGHSSGIYSFKYLYELGNDQPSSA